MAQWHTIAFTSLELRGLWVKATGGSTDGDPLLEEAAEHAIEKVHRAETGMNPQRVAREKKPEAKRRGKEVTWHAWGCTCRKCRIVAGR